MSVEPRRACPGYKSDTRTTPWRQCFSASTAARHSLFGSDIDQHIGDLRLVRRQGRVSCIGPASELYDRCRLTAFLRVVDHFDDIQAVVVEKERVIAKHTVELRN